MARYTGAVCRLCRRSGEKLLLKGARCFTPKCAVDKRPKAPGQGTGRGGRRGVPHPPFTPARARQLVRHGHILLNGRKTNIPSALVKEGDTVNWREGSQKTEYFKQLS